MSDNQKYYYLRLVDNFFDRDEMIILESMPDGYMYSNILLKLYLRSLKNTGKLMFNDRIPYNSTMLASITRHPVAVVEKAVEIFEQLGLVEILDNGAIYMLDIQNFIGKSSTEADRKREYRERIDKEKKLLLGQKEGQMSDKTPPELEIELEKEIEIEKELDSKIEDTKANKQTDLAKFSKLYEQNIGMINQLTADWLIEMSNTIDYQLFKRGIEICTERGIVNQGYLKGVIKRWLDNNITTYEQLKAYELQKKANQKPKKEFNLKIDSLGADDDNRPATQEELDELARLEEMLEGE